MLHIPAHRPMLPAWVGSWIVDVLANPLPGEPGSKARMVHAARAHIMAARSTQHPLERADLLSRAAYFRRIAAKAPI